jgi:predicted RNA-binding protein with PIN domain
MNVIGTRPDGWWRDRDRAVRALVARLEVFASDTGDDVAVVFDGRSVPAEPPGGAVRVDFARGGRGAADDEIAARTASDHDPGALTVVTSDAALAARVRAHGATVTGAGAFRRRLDHPSPPS